MNVKITTLKSGEDYRARVGTNSFHISLATTDGLKPTGMVLITDTHGHGGLYRLERFGDRLNPQWIRNLFGGAES